MSNLIKIDKLIRSKRRSISIEIDHENNVIVKAPLSMSQGSIEEFVQSKEKWVTSALKKISDQPKLLYPEILENSLLLYLGDYYTVKIRDSVDIKINKDTIEIPDYFKKRNVKRWYIKTAEEIIKKRLEYYCQKTGYTYKKFNVRAGLKTIGSCSRTGNLSFSWMLILAPLEVIDYLVVHEITHLRVKNHSKVFWNEVAKVLPNYKIYKKTLNKFHPSFIIYKKYL